MEQEIKYIQCSHCKKQIGEDKIDLHEAFCLKNCEKCKFCNEFLSHDLMEDHVSEKHRECQFCKKFVANNSVRIIHEENCISKGFQCNLCKVSFSAENFSDHVQHCSAKSDTCYHCFQNILRKDREDHEKKCISLKNDLLPLLNRTISDKQIYAQKDMFDTISDIEFIETLTQQIQLLSSQTGISEGKSIKYLEQNHWDSEKAYNFVVQNQYMKGNVNTGESDIENIAEIRNSDICLRCLEPLQQKNENGNTNYFALNCNHRACQKCYSEWIKSQFYYGQKMLISPCIIQGCSEIIGLQNYREMLSEQQFLKYLQFLQFDALQHSSSYIQCPKKLCGLILQCHQSNLNIRNKLFNIMCPNCETYFCNYCREEAHKPISCKLYLQFKNQIHEEKSINYQQYQLSKKAFEYFAKNRKSMLEMFNSTNQNNQYFRECYGYALNLTIEALLVRGWGFSYLLLLEKKQNNQQTIISQLQNLLEGFKTYQVNLSQTFKVFQSETTNENATALNLSTKKMEDWLRQLTILVDQVNIQEEYNINLCEICNEKIDQNGSGNDILQDDQKSNLMCQKCILQFSD